MKINSLLRSWKIGTILDSIAGMLAIVVSIASIYQPDQVVYKIAVATLLIICFVLSISISVISILDEKKEAIRFEKKCQECRMLESQISELKYDLYKMSTYISDGRKIIQNTAYINFDITNNQYLICISKKFQPIDDTITSTTINLFADRFPEDKSKSQAYYYINKIAWDMIGLSTSLKVTHSDGTFDLYDGLTINDIERLNNRWIAKIDFSTQEARIMFDKDDIVDFSYSFHISNELWGNYLVRPLSYYQENTIIYFGKNNNFSKTDIKVYLVDRYGRATQLPNRQLKWSEDALYYRLELITSEIFSDQARGMNYKIYWNAENIFNKKGINASCVESLGVRAVIIDEN